MLFVCARAMDGKNGLGRNWLDRLKVNRAMNKKEVLLCLRIIIILITIVKSRGGGWHLGREWPTAPANRGAFDVVTTHLNRTRTLTFRTDRRVKIIPHTNF